MKMTPTIISDDDLMPEFLREGTELLGGLYTIGRFLNSGGFGMTYLAQDSLEREVVIKECFPTEICVRDQATGHVRPRTRSGAFERIVQNFHREAKSVATLYHPNIVHVHNVFSEGGTAFIAMDYVHGTDLLELIYAKSPLLKPEVLVPILYKLLGALDYVHAHGVLHRDISPDNILLDENNTPVLIDFGSAGANHGDARQAQTRLHAVKDGYSPQELYIEGLEQTPSTDLYALGATFYHAISGQTPPSSQSRLNEVAEGSPDSYVPLVGRIEGYSDALLSSIDKALMVSPKARFQNAQEWLTAIEADPSSENVITLSNLQAPGAALAPGAQTATTQTGSQGRSDKDRWLIAGYASVAAAATVGLAVLPQLYSSDVSSAAVAVEAASAPTTATETVALAAEQPSLPPSAPTTFVSEPVGAALQSASQDTPPTRPSILSNNTDLVDANAGLAAIVADLKPEPLGPLAVIPTSVMPEVGRIDFALVSSRSGTAPNPLFEDLAPNTQTSAPEIAALPVPRSPANSWVLSVMAAPEPNEIELSSTIRTAASFFRNDPVVAGPAVSAASEREAASRDPKAETATKIDLGFTTNAVATEFGQMPQISSVAEDAITVRENPWLREGLTIVSINGFLIENPEELEIAFRANATEENDTLTGTLTVFAEGSAEVTEVTLNVPIQQTTTLETGAIFSTVNARNGWQTVVVEPGLSVDGLLPNDVVVRENLSGVPGTSRDFVTEVLAYVAAIGGTEAEFIINRDGRELSVFHTIIVQ